MATHHHQYVLPVMATAAVIGAFTTIKVRCPTVIIDSLGATMSGVVCVSLTAIASQVLRWAVFGWWNTGKKSAVYGLQHGRLHLQAETAMWMNMVRVPFDQQSHHLTVPEGYWKNAKTSTTMGEACRDLLSAVLAQAGFSQESETTEVERGVRRTKCLIDLGVGCGDQTVYLMSRSPVRPSDRTWWDARGHCVKFDQYIGITNDVAQAQYAFERIKELKTHFEEMRRSDTPDVELFCADAGRPESWDKQLEASVQRSREATQEYWVLALDTAYHFAPSRWHLINHSHRKFNASFMAFDLCISPTATAAQRLMLRNLTTLMGAPWPNITTPAEYRARLVQAGYHEDDISITDVSEHVFMPLAEFLERQDKRLGKLGLDIGALGVAKTMFAWWGRTGVVRGMIVVAKYSEKNSHSPI